LTSTQHPLRSGLLALLTAAAAVTWSLPALSASSSGTTPTSADQGPNSDNAPADASAPETTAPEKAASPATTGQLQEVTVSAQRLGLIGTATSASQGVVDNTELQLTPTFRPGQLLETVPGLSVLSHSGEGKANQFILRGYNLDHGTDIGIWVDGMPVNEPSHAHGQGYADINFLIPELAQRETYTEGPYYADQGDFSSVGSTHISYANTIADQVDATVGTFNFERVFAAGTQSLAEGHLLEAVEAKHYDGPWNPGDDQRETSSVLRFSSGGERRGYSVTGMFYHDLWNATTDQPQRAIREGLISRFGTLDPSDAGYSQRGSLSGQFHDTMEESSLLVSAYVISNRLTLWNDFTHYLVDPINGDQEQQHEDRTTFGADGSYSHDFPAGGFHSTVLVGAHLRYDFNQVSRLPTRDRVLLTTEQLAAAGYPPSFSEADRIHLGSEALYAQVTTIWTYWLRSVVGLREDLMSGSDAGTNAGNASASLAQPKVSLAFTPLPTSEIYLSYGEDFHSDDLRGVNQARGQGLGGAPLLARQYGEEIGLRQQISHEISGTFALYNLDAQSETTYDPDVGQDSPGPGSHRYGAELNLTYEPLRWLEFYGSFSIDHSRFTSLYDDGTGHVGRYLPNAPEYAGSLNIYLKAIGPWDGDLQYRLLGPYPLSSDNAVHASGYGEWDADVHYLWRDGWTFGAGLYNLLNTHANAVEFWYIDRLRAEPPEGVPDIHVHPLEPFTLRLTVGKRF
jgi:hypothetical protein